MAKNYSAIYDSTNDASALEARFYLKKETTRGTLLAPTGADFLFTLAGSSISFNQPFEASPHRSGRHLNNVIKKKKEQTWAIQTYVNINTAVSAGTTELDPAVRELWKSLLGRETVSSGVIYDSNNAPDITFSLYEVGDKWARQAAGCFVNNMTAEFPGDGESTLSWEGAGKDALLIGIGKSTANNNAGNTITVQSTEGKRFRIGGLVMLIEANGTTRSADTPDGSPRKITNVVGDVVTVDGAVLADADGSMTPVYLCYYEPASPVGIDNPQTGLVGSVAITGLPDQCPRSVTISFANDHELVNYCFGEDSLANPYFVPGDRLKCMVSITMNLNAEIVEFFNKVQDFTAQDVEVILGDATTRHLKIDLPKVLFPVPAFEVPDTGSIPVEFADGMALQTALDAADEVTVSYL